jgi:hypothetical protein
MQRSLYKLFLAPLSVLLLASFALAPMAEARGGGGGLGGGGTALAAAATCRSITASATCAPPTCATPASITSMSTATSMSMSIGAVVAGTTTITPSPPLRRHRHRRGDRRRRRFGRTKRAPQLLAIQLQRHGVSAVRQQLVPAAVRWQRRPVRGGQSTVLRSGSSWRGGRCRRSASFARERSASSARCCPPAALPPFPAATIGSAAPAGPCW